MSILDQFFILFASNAKDVERDMKAADKATDDLNDTLKKADQTASGLGLSFSKLALAGVAALEGFASLNKLKDAIAQAVDYNAEIEKTSILTGVSSREIAVWNGLVARAGGDPGGKEYLNFLRSLNEQYAGLGVNDRIKRVNEDLIKFSEKFYEMEQRAPGSSQGLAAKLGIGPDLWLALKDGPAVLQANIDKQKELNFFSGELGTQALQVKQNWAEVKTQLTDTFAGATPLVLALVEAVKILVTGLHALVELAYQVGNVPFIQGLLKGVAWIGSIGKDSNTVAAASAAANSLSSGAPIGLRNNNPGNLRSWQGAGSSGGFAQFATLADGLHAEDRQLQLYGQRGINTLAWIAATWAPGRDGNDVQAYVAALQKSTGFDPYARLDLNDPSVRARIAAGINSHENGAAYGDLANQQIAPIIGAAQAGIAQADSSPLNGVQTAGNKTLQIGSITIQTQATDADGISRDLHGALQQHFDETISSYDDGVAY